MTQWSLRRRHTKDSFGKGQDDPISSMPIEVADIVSTMTKDEEVICAAVLHDTIEDCSGITWDVLKLRFGGRVADMVAQESEDKSMSWEERKGATIQEAERRPDRSADDRASRTSFPICGISTETIR